MAIVRSKNSPAIWQVLALLLSALYVVPMLYIVMTSLTPGNEPVGQVPSHLVFSNYVDAFAASDFGVFLFNSVVVDTLHWRHLWAVAGLIWAGTLTGHRDEQRPR